MCKETLSGLEEASQIPSTSRPSGTAGVVTPFRYRRLRCLFRYRRLRWHPYRGHLRTEHHPSHSGIFHPPLPCTESRSVRNALHPAPRRRASCAAGRPGVPSASPRTHGQDNGEACAQCDFQTCPYTSACAPTHVPAAPARTPANTPLTRGHAKSTPLPPPGNFPRRTAGPKASREDPEKGGQSKGISERTGALQASRRKRPI